MNSGIPEEIHFHGHYHENISVKNIFDLFYTYFEKKFQFK